MHKYLQHNGSAAMKPRSAKSRRLMRDYAHRLRTGVAAVELAVVLPVVITLFLGCADFARAIHAQIALSNAARVGAEYGATNRFTAESEAEWVSEIEAAVAMEAATIDHFLPADLDVNVTTVGSLDVDLHVEVCAEYTFRTAVQWPGLPSEVRLRHCVTMRHYQ